MKIENFVASILPSIARDNVLEDIRITEGELKTTTIPAYQHAAPFFKSWKFQNDISKDYQATFSRIAKGHSGDLINVIAKGLPTVLGNLAVTEVEIKKVFAEDTAAGGMSYLKAQLLQYVEMAGFVSRYAMKLLVLIYAAETSSADAGETVITECMAPAQLEWLKLNFVNFCTAFAAVTLSVTDTEKAFRNIPDIVVTPENAKTLPATVGLAKIDPMGCGLIPVKLNPIYHIRMRIAEWQTRRYDAAKDELKLCQLRQLNLERVAQNKPDPRIQKEIEYIEERTQKLAAKIAEMEREYA